MSNDPLKDKIEHATTERNEHILDAMGEESDWELAFVEPPYPTAVYEFWKLITQTIYAITGAEISQLPTRKMSPRQWPNGEWW